ncbi:uncharacterized protein HMPREF1541_08853 [Cyphellophora europaea CBS 101466]|uniref:RSE1/DDB1/CPSF1 first beta-propeller domain-containing protein n=1 Tax=Cyphellophora europaea (strain CBS 101466) TaxID=1220924 RepID=W2RJQ3_CYPE1|nr:uncharacterized protein HMPREF1541_08853 [Cyphellophora europaea CBS 101466]ETN36575.1 hypothetical protein HMPREF1541_08853 [Cyphellophora europaea CBS 101466]
MDVPPPPFEMKSPQMEGILKHTLSTSPCVRWILPARIRCPSKEDLVFIGQTSVQLREFVSKGDPHLAEAICKLDLNDSILSATVISSKIETVSTIEQTLRQTVEDEQFTVDGRAIRDDEPPQILVLSTTRCELVFVYAHQAYDGAVRFIYAKRPLLTGTGLGDQLGSHLAKDPESRAIAIAPSSGHFIICALRPLDQIRNEVANWTPANAASFTPWLQQRFIQVDGAIVRMEFLHSPKDEPSRVILVLLVAKQGRSYILLYRWDSTQPLHRMRPMRSSGQLLPKRDGIPLMLIPCTASASFLLVTETEFVLYNRVTHSEAKRTAYEFQDPGAFNGHRRTKLWTQWGRPRRTYGYRKKSDEVVLVREDGYMATYEINVQSDVKVTFASSPGNLGFSMDTAFCFLAAPLHINGGDIIIAGGSMAEGGVYHLAATQRPRRIQTLVNGAPFNDLLLLPAANSSSSHALARPRPRIYSCCGNYEGQGSLAEIQYGLEAETGWTMEHPDVTSILRIWALEIEAMHTLLLLSSHPTHTSLITLGLDTAELEYVDDNALPGVELDASTLAAATIENGALIQITTENLNVISLGGHFRPKRQNVGAATPVCAAILASCAVAAVAHPSNDGYALSMCKIETSDNQSAEISELGDPYTLQGRPVSVAIADFAGAIAVLVTTDQGDLQMLLLNSRGDLVPMVALRLADLDLTLEGSSAGSCCLLSKPGSRVGLVLCGLKNGFLVCLEVLADDKDRQGRITWTLVSLSRLGLTTVTVTADEYSRQGGIYDTALIAYDSTLERLSIRANEAGAELDWYRVFIRNRDDPSLPQDLIHAVNRVPRLMSHRGADTAGLLVHVTPSDIAFSSIVGQPKAVIKHNDTTGMAKRVIYSKFLKRLVVAVDAKRLLVSDKTQPNDVVRSGPSAVSVPRLAFAIIEDGPLGRLSFDTQQTVDLGEVGETISALTHYSPTNGIQHFEMILVALKTSHRLESGALKISSRIVSVSDKHVQNKGLATPRNVMRLPGKNVTALCPIGLSGVLIASSNELLLHDLDVSTKRWTTITRHALPSPAKEIRVQGSLVYVATERHSLLILRQHGSTLSTHGSDTRARIVSNVVPLDRHRTLLADMTDRGTILTGVVEDTMTSTLQRSYEINVPHDISRIEQSRTRCAGDARDAFIASATDGTLYSFLLLTADEWLLCHFLQGLCDPFKRVIGKHKAFMQTLDASEWISHGKGTIPPASMGIDGDLLAAMLEPGAHNLRSLLEPPVKEEDEDISFRAQKRSDELRARMQVLRQLAERVTHRVNEADVVGSVMIWLRSLMQY